jgi:ribosomal protein S27AE
MKVSERMVDTSGQIVLECSGCGERVILLGHEDDWSREHRHAFECSGCTKTVTLADRVDGTAYIMKSLLRISMKPLKLVP